MGKEGANYHKSSILYSPFALSVIMYGFWVYVLFIRSLPSILHTQCCVAKSFTLIIYYGQQQATIQNTNVGQSSQTGTHPDGYQGGSQIHNHGSQKFKDSASGIESWFSKGWKKSNHRPWNHQFIAGWFLHAYHQFFKGFEVSLTNEIFSLKELKPMVL